MSDPFKQILLDEDSPTDEKVTWKEFFSRFHRKPITLPEKDEVREPVRRRYDVEAWFDQHCSLERLAPARDLVLLCGFGCVVAGIWLWSLPGGLIALGMGLMAASWLMSR